MIAPPSRKVNSLTNCCSVIVLAESVKERVKSVVSVSGFEAAFPDDDYVPSSGFQLADIFCVSLAVAFKFRLPVFQVSFRHNKTWMPFMHVPEASVNKYNGLVLGKDNIRCTGIAFVVFAVSETVREEKFSDEAFRFCVSTPDVLHVAVSLLFGQIVSRLQSLLSGREKSIK